MQCFVCNTNPPTYKFYCKLCKKCEICDTCWKTLLHQKFQCPFDKNTDFILEISPQNKLIYLSSDSTYPTYYFFTQFPLYEYIGTVKFENYQPVPLTTILYYYIPYYQSNYMTINLSYLYHFVKTFSYMQIIQTIYEKWVFVLILTHILRADFHISVNHVHYFGGVEFISFINKYFNYKIYIDDDIIDTLITFDTQLWKNKIVDQLNNFESDII